MTTEEVLDALGISGTRGKAICPSHDDDKASLSITVSEEGKILFRCHAGCDQIDVLRGLEAKYGITSRDLGNGGEKTRREVARYVYKDGGGKPIFTKIRFDPKEFVIEPAGADTKSALYRLPEIMAASPVKTVVWVEGEKAVDRLQSAGFLATTLGGASKSPDKAVKALKGRRVVILPDNDDAGRKHAETVSRCMTACGVQLVRTLNLPGLPVKGDVVDWLDSGRTSEELDILIRRATARTPASAILAGRSDWMWSPRIPSKGLTLIFGEAGIGKTTMVLDLVSRWTRGDAMPESVGRFKPTRVAMYGFEDDIASVVVPRLMAAGANLDLIEFLELDINKPVLPDQIDRIRQLCVEMEAGVLVMDNIENSMGNGIDSNNSRSLRVVLSPLNDLGFPVLAIHHPKKGSAMTLAREAMSGSQAYTNVSRSVLEVIQCPEPEPDGTNLVALTAVKSNYAPVNKTRTLYFKLESRIVEGSGEQPKVEWVGGDNTTGEMIRAKIREVLFNGEGKPGGRPKTELDLIPALHDWKSSGDLASFYGVSQDTISRRLGELLASGQIEKRGENNTTEYRSHVYSLSINTKSKGFAEAAEVLNPVESTTKPPQNGSGGFAEAVCMFPTEDSHARIKSWVEDERRKAGIGQDTDDK